MVIAMNPPPPPAAAPPHFHPHTDLPTSLSTLTSLLHLCKSTINSLSITAPTTTPLLPCPFNPNHHLPPSSLFSHHLNCPFPLCLPNPHYPDTLHSTTPPTALNSTTADLQFSLENYVDVNQPANKFFYQNCPAPVTPTIRPIPLLVVPRILYVECAEYSTHREQTGLPVSFIKFLPSEVWAIRSEIETWNGSSPHFSIRILRSIMRLRDCELSHLNEWIVARSPNYGVIIDLALQDHLILLTRFCLKAIVREAFELVGYFFGSEVPRTEEVPLPSQLSQQSFECPILGEVLIWLALQFGVLYGQVNGKFFAVEILKECIRSSAMGCSLFSLEAIGSDSQNVGFEVRKPGQESLLVDESNKKEINNLNCGSIQGSVISISQVAAAVAALHERSLMENKIRSLRKARPLTAHQRNSEHAYLSKMADEERQKRPNYRPIIDHDGLLWQRSHDQDANKLKTREELLAEERDYKRRRMSYRGKKLKRNTVEVTRDIIEEYMEEIRQSGGIGSSSNAMHTPSASSPNNPVESVSESRRDLQVSGTSEGLDNEIDQSASQNHKRNVRLTGSVSDHYSGGSKSSSHSKQSRKTRDFAVGKTDQRSHEENNHKRERFEDEHRSRKREKDEHHQSSGKREINEDTYERRSRRESRKRDREDVGHTDRKLSKRNKYTSSIEDRYDPAESRHSNEDDS